MNNIKALTKKILIDILNIPSYSGNEKLLAEYFYELLEKNNFNVEFIEHSQNRNSLIAYYGNPKIAFCTHLDTAIEWKAPRIENNVMYGIGACDAKASLACQTSVAIELSKKQKDIAVLFLAGEETDSIGAKYIRRNPIKNIIYVIHGEPTKGEFISRTASVLELEVKTKGEKGHSSCKNNDISAIHKLLKLLNKIQDICEKYNLIFHIGNVDGGGNSPSSFPKVSSAMIQIRGYLNSDIILEIIKNQCDLDTTLEVLYENNTCNLLTLEGYNSKEVMFGSDAAILQDIYKQLLVGPGDIERAHKPNEYITEEELFVGLKCLEDAYGLLEK